MHAGFCRVNFRRTVRKKSRSPPLSISQKAYVITCGMKRYPHGPKSGWEEQAQAIASGAIPTSLTDLPMLLEWLQDMNWPGATRIAQHLATFEEELVEPLRMVLRSGDGLWIHWGLLSFGHAFDPPFWAPLAGELQQIASGSDSDARIDALRLLTENGFSLPECAGDGWESPPTEG